VRNASPCLSLSPYPRVGLALVPRGIEARELWPGGHPGGSIAVEPRLPAVEGGRSWRARGPARGLMTALSASPELCRHVWLALLLHRTITMPYTPRYRGL
jgi:hypothetical protein